jgi:hypothetical protein
MGHDSLFDNAWLKWVWAIGHSQALEREIQSVGQDGSTNPILAFRAEYHAKRHGFAVIVEKVEPMPVKWRLRLGDIANSYRAALDHLAWALVSRGNSPPPTLSEGQERAVSFPLYDTLLKYEENVSRRLPGVRPSDLKKVRACQPYHHSEGFRPRNPFWLLAAINNGDKHRTIQPLWAHPSRIDIEVTHTRDCVLRTPYRWSRRGNPLEPETEIAFMHGRKLGDNPEVEIKLDVASTPTIGNRISIREWQTATGRTIFKLLRKFAPQPASIHELGVELAPLPPG